MNGESSEEISLVPVPRLPSSSRLMHFGNVRDERPRSDHLTRNAGLRGKMRPIE